MKRMLFYVFATFNCMFISAQNLLQILDANGNDVSNQTLTINAETVDVIPGILSQVIADSKLKVKNVSGEMLFCKITYEITNITNGLHSLCFSVCQEQDKVGKYDYVEPKSMKAGVQSEMRAQWYPAEGSTEGKCTVVYHTAVYSASYNEIGKVVYTKVSDGPSVRVRYILGGDESTENGYFGNIKYSFYPEDGTATVCKQDSSLNGDIVIPEFVNEGYRVTGIKMGAFAGTDISSIILPKSLIELPDYCFQNCKNLSKVVLPENIQSIWNNCFEGCVKLTNIEIPHSITTLEKSCFEGCSNLQAVVIRGDLLSIDNTCFSGCRSLDFIFLDNTIKNLPSNFSRLFSASTNIKVINFSEVSLENSELNVYTTNDCITWKNNVFSYTGIAPTIDYVNNINEYECLISYNSPLEKDAGTYTISYSLTYKNENFSATFENFTYSYTIEKAPLFVSVNNVERLYGDDNPQFGVTVNGLLNDENNAEFSVEYFTTANNRSNVGVYPINASVKADNYEIAIINGTLTINKAPITIAVNDVTRIYGEDNPVFDCKYSGFKLNDNAETAISKKPSFSTEATPKSNVGTYAITASGAEAQNYDIDYTPGVLTVNKALLKIRANDVTREYGDANPKLDFTATGYMNEDSDESLDIKPIATCAADINSNVGYYEIAISGAESPNYEFTYESGELTVTKAPLSVVAESCERLYGDSNPSFTRSYLGFKLNDDERTSFSVLPSISCDATITSDVGEYPITVSGGKAKNYEILAYENGVLNITKAPLVLTAHNATRLYFEENPDFDYSLSGLRNSDTKACITVQPTFACTATKTSNAGEYEIRPSDADAKNYSIEYRQGSLTINQRQLTASVGNYTRTYGEENPTFDVIYSGFVNDENESVLSSGANATCSATETSDVGTYPIKVTGGSGMNYLVTKYNSGTLTIEKADQTITWEQDLFGIPLYTQLALEAASSSGLPVTYEMSPNNVATLYNNGGKWYLDCYGSGTVTIRAVQNGDKNHNPAQMIIKQLVVSGNDGGGDNFPQIFLNVENAGTLSSLIAENKKYQIKNLRLSGYLNGTDINFLREMAGSDNQGNTTPGVLETLDIAGCTIVSGGRSYYKSNQTSDNTVGLYMFYNCKVLVNLTLPDNSSTIEGFAFADCERLSTISIPNGVTSFGEQAFRNNISLVRIPMPLSLKSIGDKAFMGCNGITELTLPSKLSYLGDGILNDCQNIARINVEEGNSYFASKDGVLYDNSRDKLLIFPANYEASSYAVLEGTTRIAPYAFVNAKKLKDVTLPSSLLTIGSDAFIGCVNISTLYAQSITPPTCENDCFEEISKTRCELKVPVGCYNYYWVAPVWSEFNKIVEIATDGIDGVTTNEIKVSVARSKITIAGVPENVVVYIYLMDGTLIYETRSDGNDVFYQTSSKGPHLVVVGNKTYIVFVR